METPVRIRVVALALLFCMPLTVSASLSDKLDGMLSSSTSPGSYNSQNRMGLVGGDLSLRFGNQTVNLFNLDPPRLDAGCGGIDMYGGSFSFISKDKLVAIFRNIGQMAVAALFKLAVNSISEKLGGVMTEFSAIMRELNNLSMNSCKISNAFATDIKNGNINSTAAMGQEYASIKDNVSFHFSRMGRAMDCLLDPKCNAGKIAAADDNAVLGNNAWRAIAISKAYEKVALYYGDSTVGGASDADKRDANNRAAQLIMNVMGGTVLPSENKANATASTIDNEDALKNSSDSWAPTKANDNIRYSKTLTALMLIEPKASDEVITCSSDVSTSTTSGPTSTIDSCVELKPGPVGSLLPDKGGMARLAYKILMGCAYTNDVFNDMDKETCTGSSTSAASTSSTSTGDITGGILYYVINGRDYGDFPAAGTFLKAGAIKAPILRHLVTLQRDPEAMKKVSGLYAKLLAADLAAHFAETIGNAAALAASAKGISPSHDWRENIMTFNSDVAGYRMLKYKASEETAFMDLVARTASSLGSGSIGIPGSARKGK